MLDDDQVQNVKRAGQVKSVSPGERSSKIFAVIAVLAIIAAGYFFLQSRNNTTDDANTISQENIELSANVVSNLSSVLLLSEEDEPTVATIDDADSLREANPDFYADANNGDFLILYPQRAIIFRDSESFIINIAPILNSTGSSADIEQ